MQIITSFNDFNAYKFPCVIALGTFDGLHRGHRDVIVTARDYAVRHGEKLAVLTFSNHPLSLIAPQQVPVSLITLRQKQEYLQSLGVDVLLNLPFDEQLAKLTPDEFLTKLSLTRISCIVVGANFTFGFHGCGNINTLLEAGEKYNFDLVVRPLISDNGLVVSSTAIRKFILEGNVGAANKMLGREYSLGGVICSGAQRGRTIGFPTANIELRDLNIAVPARGVYAVRAVIDGKTFCGMANIGKNPTFGDVAETRLEIHLFNFAENIYGKMMTVYFSKFIRQEQTFASVNALSSQLTRDKKQCEAYFASL